MFTVCVSVIALLGVLEGLGYDGEPSYLINIPRENRNDSMCRNETIGEAVKDMIRGDESYCAGMLYFLDLMMDPTGRDAIRNFIDTVNKSVYGPVIENFTITNEFSDAKRLLKTIWFKGNDSLFRRVFLENNYGNVSRISSFASHLFESTGQTVGSYHYSKSHVNCTNETEVSIAACYYHSTPKSIVYLDEVNPLFDFTVFSIAAMMGKLIGNPKTQRNLTFVVQHPDDEGCLVPLTVVYRKYNNTPPMLYTYHDIKLIYYDYDGTDGKTNFDVCDFVLTKKDDDDYDYDNYDGHDDDDDDYDGYKDDDDDEPEAKPTKPGKSIDDQIDMSASKIKELTKQREKDGQNAKPNNF